MNLEEPALVLENDIREGVSIVLSRSALVVVGIYELGHQVGFSLNYL